MRTPTERMADGAADRVGLVSLQSRQAVASGESGRTNSYGDPLPLVECITVTRAPEKRRSSANGLQCPLRKLLSLLPPCHIVAWTEDSEGIGPARHPFRRLIVSAVKRGVGGGSMALDSSG